MRILHIITSLDTGGAEKMLFKLLGGMDTARFENRVVCLLPAGPVGDQIKSLGIKVESLGLKRGRISPAGLIKLFRMVTKWKPDIIQTWLYHADLLGYLIAKITGVKNLIWNIRNTIMVLEKYSRVTTWTVKACAFFSDYPVKILANSDIAKDQHIKAYGYNPDKFEIVLNGFDLNIFKPDKKSRGKIRQELDIPAEAFCTGIVGRFDPQKDHRSFIKAAKFVTQHLPEMFFIMVGKGVDENNTEITSLIKELDMQDRFRLMGERKDIPDIMNAFDLYCSSSSFGEGFPNVVGEAMACGVPCVVTDVGQSGLVVDSTGYVVPPGSVELLAERIVTLAKLPVIERSGLGILARKRVEDNYSLEHIVREYEEIYMKVGQTKQ